MRNPKEQKDCEWGTDVKTPYEILEECRWNDESGHDRPERKEVEVAVKAEKE